MLNKYLAVISVTGIVAAILASALARDIGAFMFIAPIFLVLGCLVYFAWATKD